MVFAHRILLLPAVISTLSLFAAADDARNMAEQAIEKERDETHREEMIVTYPPMQDVPPVAEVYMIEGYISYRCTRLTWKNGKASALSVNMKRSWFYNAKGESYSSEAFDIDAEAFKTVWQAAMLVNGSQAVRKKNRDENDDHHGSFGSSSHASYHWLRLSSGEQILYNDCIRGTHSMDGIVDYKQIQNAALRTVLLPLFGEFKNGKPAPLADWGPSLALEISRAGTDLSAEKLEKTQELLLETSLRVLGEIGYAPATEDIKKLEERASQLKNNLYSESICHETQQALVKIRFINHWDADAAHAEITRNLRELHSQTDLVKWLRRQYFERDKAAYLARLLADLKEFRHDENLLQETIVELQQKYPEQPIEPLMELLSNRSPQVAADAALAVLKSEPENKKAIEVLSNLASNVAVEIPASSPWYVEFGRHKAFDYFTLDRAPKPRRWTKERQLEQLNREGEDGRMIEIILGSLKRSYGWEDKDATLAAWRRVLSQQKINFGTMAACEKLIELGDTTSEEKIEKVLAELSDGRNSKLNWQRDPLARYPWVDKYMIERVQKKLDELKLKSKPIPENF